MANKRRTVLYTGSAEDIVQRVYLHKSKRIKNSFTARYNVDQLVYYEEFPSIGMAYHREKQIKNLLRKKKVELIESKNPEWKDLFKDAVKKYYQGKKEIIFDRY
jgi:putative endonuclease